MGTLLFLFKLLGFISEKASERKKFYIDDKYQLIGIEHFQRLRLIIQLF